MPRKTRRRKSSRRLMLQNEQHRHRLRDAIARLDKLRDYYLKDGRYIRRELRRVRKLLGRKPK